VGSFSQETCNISETGQDRTKVTIDEYDDQLEIAFDWCQNQRPWMTLKGHYAFSFKTRGSFGAHHENLNEDRLYCQRRLCSAMTLDSGNIRIMRIFAVVLKIYVNFPDFMPTPLGLYYVYTYLTLFRYQVQLFCLLQLLSANMAATGCKVWTS